MTDSEKKELERLRNRDHLFDELVAFTKRLVNDYDLDAEKDAWGVILAEVTATTTPTQEHP